MISVIATIKVKKDCRDSFVEVFKANVPNVLAEEGCVEYTPTIDFESGIEVQNLDDHVVTIIEKWETIEHLKAHLVAPHMLEFREKAKDFIDNVSLKILQNA